MLQKSIQIPKSSLKLTIKTLEAGKYLLKVSLEKGNTLNIVLNVFEF